MTSSVDNDDTSSNLINQDMAGAVESADACLAQILGAVTMATTDPPVESVISESANVVVERMSSGSPTWTYTATASDRRISGDGPYIHDSKDDGSSFFDLQGSGLLTQAQLRQIGEALRAEVTPTDTVDLQVGMMGHEPATSVGMESAMIGTDPQPQDLEGVVRGDNPMFSGSDQQEEQYDELSLHAEDEVVEELEGERNPMFGLSDSADSKQLSVGLDDSGLGTRHLFEDVMNAGLLAGVVKDEVLVPHADIAATATVTTSEEGEILTSSSRGRKPKTSVTPKREGTRRSARLAQPASTDDTSSDTTEKMTDDNATKDSKLDVKTIKEDEEDTSSDTTDKMTDDNLIKDSEHDVKTVKEEGTSKGRSLRRSSKQQRNAEPYNSKFNKGIETLNKSIETLNKSTEKASDQVVEEEKNIFSQLSKTQEVKKEEESGKKNPDNVVKKKNSISVIDNKKVNSASDTKKLNSVSGRKISISLSDYKKIARRVSVGSKGAKAEKKDSIDKKPKHEEKGSKGQSDRKESLEEGELEEGDDHVDDLEEGEVIDSPKKVKVAVKIELTKLKIADAKQIVTEQEKSRTEKEGSRSNKTGSKLEREASGERLRERSTRGSKLVRAASLEEPRERSRGDREGSSRSEKESSRRRHRRDSKERRHRRSSSERRERREARMRRREQRQNRDSDSDISDDKPLTQAVKESMDNKVEGSAIKELPRRYSLDDMKKLASPPMARRSKPFSAADQQRKKVKIQLPQQQPGSSKKPADSNEESDISLSSSDHGGHDVNDSDWTTDDDPEKLWCICRRPADNRFMIRCDDCAEWYHGNCVNISKQEGQRLEKENIQWICPHCVKKDKREGRTTMPKSEKDRHHHSSKREDRQREDRHESSRSHEHRSHDHKSHDSSKKKSKDKKKRLKFSKPEPPKQHCLGIKCENWAKPSAIYCSTRCIISHCRDALKLLEEEKEKATGGSKHRRDSFGDALAPESSAPADREPERVSVIERHTGRLRSGLSAPTRLQLPIWLERHPTYEVLKPNMKHGYTTSQFYSGKSKHSSSKDKDSKGEIREGSKSSSTPGKVRRDSESKSPSRRDSATKRERRDSHHEAGSSKKADDGKKSKTPTKTPPSKAAVEVEDSVRMSVKRALWDALWTRVKGSDDFNMPEHKVKKIAYNIENHLFKIYNEANLKYKAKYRSLIFNIKDPKNQGLFRRILKQRIPADELVCMSSDKLASKDLAEWREREQKHVLEMIVTEEENRKETKPLTKKTHKGEEEICEDSLLETNPGSTPLKISVSGHDSLTSPSLTSPTNPLNMLEDTTQQHNNHLFDMNCKICTGKVAAPKETITPVTEVKAAKRSRSFSSSDRQSSVEDEVTKKRQLYRDEEEEEEEGDKEEGELDEEEEDIATEKPSYSYSEDADAGGDSPEYDPPDVSNSPDGDNNMQSSYLPESTSSSYQPISPSSERDDDEPDEPPQYTAPSRDVERPLSPAMSSPEEEVTKHPKRIIPPVIWKGSIGMPEVAKFSANGYHVSGPPHTIAMDIPEAIEICGRIPYKMVWDYFNKLRKSKTTDLVIARFHIQQDSDKPAYAALFQYFHSRKRIGVVGNNRPHVKDMYLLPLAAQDEVPPQIQPFNGPGMERHRPHSFLGLIVRHKEQRGRSASMGHMPVSARSALPSGLAHPAPLKRHMSQPGPSSGGTPPLPDWTEPGYDPKRAKQERAIPEARIEDPIVVQYANADPTELAEEPYSPTREEREAPYDPMDVMDDIGQRRIDVAQTIIKDTGGGTPPMPPPDEVDPRKLNELLESVGELNANDIAHAASDVTENLLTAFSSKPNLTEQQQLLIKLTKQVEDAKKALLDRQIASLQSEIDKAADEITDVGAEIGDPTATTTPDVTATMIHQLPGTKLPSPRILRAPADSSTNNPDQRPVPLSGSPGTPTEEDAQGRSALDMIQNAYVDPNLGGKQTTYTYGNVFTEGGATYPSQGLPPMQGGPPVGGNWQGPPIIGDKRHPNDNNNQPHPEPPPNWNNPPFGGPDGGPPQPWDKPPFQATPDNMPLNPALNPQPFNPEAPFQQGHQDRHDRKKRDFEQRGGSERFPPDGRPGKRFPPDGRPDRPPHRERAPPNQQLEEGELSDLEEREAHHRSGPPPGHRSGPPSHEPWRSRGQGPRHDRGSHHDQRGSGPRRDDQRGHGYRDHGRGEGGRRGYNGPDRGRGKFRGQGPRGRDQGHRGRDSGGDTRYDYHRY